MKRLSGIGQPRIYDATERAVIYPGEQASAIVAVDAAERVRRGESIVAQWFVEPSPGRVAAVVRACYAVVGPWLESVGVSFASELCAGAGR